MSIKVFCSSPRALSACSVSPLVMASLSCECSYASDFWLRSLFLLFGVVVLCLFHVATIISSLTTYWSKIINKLGCRLESWRAVCVCLFVSVSSRLGLFVMPSHTHCVNNYGEEALSNKQTNTSELSKTFLDNDRVGGRIQADPLNLGEILCLWSYEYLTKKIRYI